MVPVAPSEDKSFDESEFTGYPGYPYGAYPPHAYGPGPYNYGPWNGAGYGPYGGAWPYGHNPNMWAESGELRDPNFYPAGYRYGSPTNIKRKAKAIAYDPLSKTYLQEKEWRVTTRQNTQKK